MQVFKNFITPTYGTILRKELDEAKRELLKAQTGLDFATSMVAYNSARVARLTALMSSGDSPDYSQTWVQGTPRK